MAMTDSQPQTEPPPNHPQIGSYRHHLTVPVGERPVLSVRRDKEASQRQPRALRQHGHLILPFDDRRPPRVLDVFKDQNGNFFTNDPLLRGSFVSLDSIIREASLSFRNRTQEPVVPQDGPPDRPRQASRSMRSSLRQTRYRPQLTRTSRAHRTPSSAHLQSKPLLSEELVAPAAESASPLTLQKPEVTSSEELIDVASSEELTTVSPQTLPAHNITEGSPPSGHCYSASCGPTIFLRSPPEWYFTFFIRRDRGGCFRMYPDMGGPFQSLQEAEDTIDAHIVKLQRQAKYNEQDDVPYVERLIRRCVFYPDGTPKRGPNCPGRKNPYYEEHNLVQAILDQYNDDHNLLGDLAHELKGDVSFQWIHEASASYYHFNFTTKTKEAGTANLFFAEVSQMQRDGDWMLSCCCMIGPNDNGGCYGCASDDSPDIKHPSHTNSYTGGHVDEYLRYGGDSCSDSDDDEEVQVAKLRIKFKEKKVIRPTLSMKEIFGGHLLSLCSSESICFHDWAHGRMLQQFEMNARDVYWSDTDGASLVAVASNASLFIFKFNRGICTFEMLHQITELVRSGSWVSDKFIYINSAWRLNYYSEGKITSMYCPMYYLDRPMHVLGYLPKQRRLHLFDKDMNIVGYPVVQILIDYKVLVMREDLEVAHNILASVPEAQHNRGYLKEAHEITTDAEHKFRLAAELGTSEVEKVAPLHRFIGLSEIHTRMNMEADYEFSWKDNLFHGQNIIPAVRDQGHTSTCIFQALRAGGEIEKMRTAAVKDPSRTTDIKFSASHFASDYEAIAGPIPHDNHKRLPTALNLFKDRGVYAQGGGAPPKRYKIASSQAQDKCFQEIAALIMDGRPVIGGFRVDKSFANLKPDEIYDYKDGHRKVSSRGKIYNHAVVFVGFGERTGRPYLVFLNSHGTGFGDRGFGRVYFEDVHSLTTKEF